MRLASELAGFTLGRGRRAAPRDGQEGRRQDAGAARRASWRAARNGASSEKKATKIFEFIEFFAGYGFNKSHSTTYALLAYQTAYLKANYPRHFMAALLDDRVAELRQGRAVSRRVPRARRARCCRPTSIGATGASSSSPTACGSVWARSRAPARAPFDRSWPTRRRAGGQHRVAVRARRARRPAAGEQEGARMPDQGGRVRLAGARRRGRLSGVAAAAGRRARPHSRPRQPSSAGPRPGAVASVRRRRRARRADADDAGLPVVAPWTETEALAFEKEALGLYMSGHPLQRYAEALAIAGARLPKDSSS